MDENKTPIFVGVGGDESVDGSSWMQRGLYLVIVVAIVVVGLRMRNKGVEGVVEVRRDDEEDVVQEEGEK